MRKSWVGAAFVLGVAFVASCGSGTDGVSPPLLPSSAAVAEVERALIRVDESLNGTWDDLQGAKRLEYLRFQQPIVQCMAAHGYSYTPHRWNRSHRSLSRPGYRSGMTR